MEVCMVKVRSRGCLDIPSESGVDAALMMEHDWPELNRFVSLDNLSRIYNFEMFTLEWAARQLTKRGILEKKERYVKGVRRCGRTVQFFRRTVRYSVSTG